VSVSELRVERTFDAPREAVFEAWTSPEVMRRWWAAEHNWSTPRAEVDLRPGERTTVVLIQRGLASEESREAHEDGWNKCFDNLETRVLLRQQPRHHSTRPPGGMGELTRGVSADAAVRVVAPPRRVLGLVPGLRARGRVAVVYVERITVRILEDRLDANAAVDRLALELDAA
jgi:Activator of Hsp90 ATPase homolog 1-like protein